MFLCSLTTFKYGPAGVMLLNVDPWRINYDGTHINTHAHTLTDALQANIHIPQWRMKKIQSVLFTPPVDEGKTLTMILKNFSPIEVLM